MPTGCRLEANRPAGRRWFGRVDDGGGQHCVRVVAVTAMRSRLGSTMRRAAAGSRRLGWLLVVGYLLHVTLRLAISYGRDGPINFADETGYLVNARVLSGGLAGQLGTAGFYRGGYSLLLVPAFWLGHGPLWEYRWVLVTNAVVSSLTFPLVYLVLARIFRVPPRLAAGAAFLAALYPPLVVTTQFAWAESLLPVLVLAAAIALAATTTATRRWAAVGWAVACGGCAGVLYTTHGRTAPLVGLLLVLLLGLAWVRRDLAPSAVAGVVAAGAVAFAGGRLNSWLRVQSWGDASGAELRRLLANAGDPGSWVNVAALGAGQYWYLFVATFGLVVPGALHLATQLRPIRWPPGPPALTRLAGRQAAGAPAVAVFLLGGAVGLAVLTGLFLNPPNRPDHVVYGRYVEMVVPAFVALGLVRLWTARTRRLFIELGTGAAAAAVAAVIITRYADGLITRSPVNWFTVLALPPFAQVREHIRPGPALLVAATGATILLLTRRSRALTAAGLAAALATSSIALRVVLIQYGEDTTRGTQPVALTRIDGLSTATEVSYDLAAYSPRGLYYYQWQLGATHFTLFSSRSDAAPHTTWVIAAPDWPQAAAVNARRVWVDNTNKQAVWRLPCAGDAGSVGCRPPVHRAGLGPE